MLFYMISSYVKKIKTFETMSGDTYLNGSFCIAA